MHALTDPTGKKGHRSTCFLVPMNTKGIAYNEMGGKMVWRQSSTGSIAFDDVFVPEDARARRDGTAASSVMAEALNGGQALHRRASRSRRPRSRSTAAGRYATERIQFDDQPIGRFQRVQDVILDLDIALESGLTWLVQAAPPLRREAASAASRRRRSRSSARAARRTCWSKRWRSAAASRASTSSGSSATTTTCS